jgi:hypothetical protein
MQARRTNGRSFLSHMKNSIANVFTKTHSSGAKARLTSDCAQEAQAHRKAETHEEAYVRFDRYDREEFGGESRASRVTGRREEG